MSRKDGLLKNKMIRKEDSYRNYWNKFSKTCPVCNCTNYMKPNVDMMYCKVCGNNIFKDDKTKFMYEMGKRLQNENIRRTIRKACKKKR